VQYDRTAAFKTLHQKLDRTRRQKVDRALQQLIHVLETQQWPRGLGLKKLRWHLWEVRVDLSDHIVFKRENDLVTFLVVGSHDDVQRFLKHAA